MKQNIKNMIMFFMRKEFVIGFISILVIISFVKTIEAKQYVDKPIQHEKGEIYYTNSTSVTVKEYISTPDSKTISADINTFNQPKTITGRVIQTEVEKKDIPITNEEKTSFIINVSEKEIERMVRSTYVETREGCYEDALAVAAAIINRYQETPKKKRKNGMFSIICNNQFGNPEYGKKEAHNFYNADMSKNNIYYKAVIEALKDNDPTKGASYFYSTHSIEKENSWHENSDNLEFSGYISPNGHKFFRLKK